MSRFEALQRPVEPDWRGLVDNILRKGTPDRVYNLELFQDWEIEQAIIERFQLAADLDENDPDYARRRHLANRRFCGFDYVRVGLSGLDWRFNRQAVEDTAGELSHGQRGYQDEHHGPIMSWEDFERYPWPDPDAPEATAELEWWQEHLPEDMCIVGSGGVGHFCEHLCWLMGYETLCFALYDQRDLVDAIAAKLMDFHTRAVRRILAYDRVAMVFGSDDMGFRGGLLLPPDDMRRYVLAGHREVARLAHEAHRPYLLHSCGNLTEIYDELVDDVGIDAKHSFEDTIEDVRRLKGTLGQRIALLGGIDLDFLCRSDEQAIRARVRDTLEVCQPGGGYCLGTGNSVANYIPLENYLAMLDEGRRYGLA